MANKATIEIKLTGQRGTETLSPGNVGVSYLIEALTHTRDLLDSDKNEDPIITVHEGSLALRHESISENLGELAHILERVGRDHFVDVLPVKMRKALYGLRKLTARHGDTVIVLDQDRELLVITKDTDFIVATDKWVDSEIYVRGTVTNAGGVSNPNLHVRTDDPRLGTLLVSASETQLSEDDKNRLYKPVSLHIAIKEHAQTGELDPRTARLLDFVETSTIKPDDVSSYVDQLIGRAKTGWSKIADKEAWLAEIRGHEG